MNLNNTLLKPKMVDNNVFTYINLLDTEDVPYHLTTFTFVTFSYIWTTGKDFIFFDDLINSNITIMINN